MGLSVYTYYETFKPHFSFRFKVDFLSNPSLYRLVQDIKLPSISINASDGRKRFGQTQFVLPFFEFGDQELEITFVETDTMKVLDYLTNNYNWPNLPNTEDIIVTEYDDTLRNVLKRTKYTITLFSYSAPQWQNSGSPSNMTITATYIVRSSRDITKDEYDLYNLPIYSPVVDMVQDMNVIGSSVDEGSAESEWQKFLGSLKDEETELEKNAELNRQRQEAMMKPMAFETNTKAKEKEKVYDEKKKAFDDSIAEYLANEYNQLTDKQKADKENDAFKRYCNQQMFGKNRDFSMMTDEEKAAMRKKFDNLSQTEKMMLIYEIETGDGLNKREMTFINSALQISLENEGYSDEELEEAFNAEMGLLADQAKEMEDAKKEWINAVNNPEKGKGGEKPKQQGTQTAGAVPPSGSEKPKQNQKPLQKYTSSNKNRDADLVELRSRMQAAGVDTTNTSQVVDYLVKDGLITTRYKKDQNGLCATGTNLVAAVTSGATQIKSTGNGKDQNLSCYGYKKVASGKGANQLDDMLKHGQLKEGDVINISYSDGSKYGHAVTVYKDKNGKLAFASDYVQKSAHGQSNANRVGEFYIQRKA